MADKTLSTIVGGGGELAPTSLDFQIVNDSGSVHAQRVETIFGAKRTANITSSTLTEVLNITGTGYFTYAALVPPSAAVTNPKIEIVIDGGTALDESSGTSITLAQHLSIVGIFSDVTTLNPSTESIIHFKESFVVSIAGDGTNGVQFGFKRVLT